MSRSKLANGLLSGIYSHPPPDDKEEKEKGEKDSDTAKDKKPKVHVAATSTKNLSWLFYSHYKVAKSPSIPFTLSLEVSTPPPQLYTFHCIFVVYVSLGAEGNSPFNVQGSDWSRASRVWYYEATGTIYTFCEI